MVIDLLDALHEMGVNAFMEDDETTNKSITFTIKVKDPDAMVAWARENITPGAIIDIVCPEEEDHFLAQIEMMDSNQATLLKTFWAP